MAHRARSKPSRGTPASRRAGAAPGSGASLLEPNENRAGSPGRSRNRRR